MKHILNYGLMAAMVAAFTFTSCSKDDDDDEKLEIELSILPKKVTKIESSNYSNGNQFTYEFDSEGRIIKKTNAFYSTIYQHTDNSVISSSEVLGINVTTTAKFETQNGRITSVKYTESTDDGVNEEEYGQLKYSYSADGYLSTMEGTMNRTVTKSNYCIENGVIKSISSNIEGDETSILMTNSGSIAVTNISMIFTYNSKILNNLNVNIWYLLYDTEPLFGDKLGKRFVQLPTSITMIGKEGEEEETLTYNFSYEYDGDYMKKISSILTYEGETETTTYEIFYEE